MKIVNRMTHKRQAGWIERGNKVNFVFLRFTGIVDIAHYGRFKLGNKSIEKLISIKLQISF